jgi:hypothetical protein
MNLNCRVIAIENEIKPRTGSDIHLYLLKKYYPQTTAIAHVILFPPSGVSPGDEFGKNRPVFQETGV